jgi:hypothetical protein
MSVLVHDARRRQEMGYEARRRVEADYSIAAWAETFVSSMTGASRTPVRGTWKVDRGTPATAHHGSEPHGPHVKTFRSLNQIGGR